MAGPVKRPYRSELRRRQAAETRRRIVEAAADLFEDRGYAGTSVREIADRAGVSPDTVYATFGSKVRVLTAVIDLRLAPPGDVESVLDLPDALAVRDATDQRDQLARFARNIAAISARVRPAAEMLRTAAAAESDVAEVRRQMEDQRMANMRVVAGWLAARGPLRVDVERAAETLWVLTSPDTARLLCDGRGWSDDDYAAWLEDSLMRTLLPDPRRRRRP